MAPITEEKHDGQTLLVSSSRLNDGTSIMFYRIGTDKPEYEIEIYSHASRSSSEDIIWLDYDAEYGCGDVHSDTFLKIDDEAEEELSCHCYYSGDSIILHAQLPINTLRLIQASNRLQLRLSIAGLVINHGNHTILLSDRIISEWKQIIVLQ
ncbi:hypothetical protein [Providencia alcalifaciens]|uniref:hypothetical protein n=1 Tax=Providencia alcalifaciens TaxID=126385 RepID=UPI001CC6AC2D|nr:hypothetical protein [Providencia alcalifaciens]CAG9408559.1 hypothetical protein NVI2019_GHJFPKLH_00367 [Providencia alcalifaciens]